MSHFLQDAAYEARGRYTTAASAAAFHAGATWAFDRMRAERDAALAEVRRLTTEADAMRRERDELAVRLAEIEQAEPQAHAVAGPAGQVYWIGATLAEAARFAGQLNCQTRLIRLIARPAPAAAPERAAPDHCEDAREMVCRCGQDSVPCPRGGAA